MSTNNNKQIKVHKLKIIKLLDCALKVCVVVRLNTVYLLDCELRNINPCPAEPRYTLPLQTV